MSSLFRGPLLLGVTIALAAASAARAQEAEQEQFVVIKAGRVITMAGPELNGVDILLVDGKVRLVGKDLSYPKTARVIDARRQLVMPGMIHPHTRWQLPSYSRSGLRGDRSAAKEVYLQEIDFEPFLQAGFTAVGFYPTGSGIPGPSMVYRVAGPDDLREIGAGYLRVSMASSSDKKTLRDAVKKARTEIEKVEKARKEWDEKQKKAKEEADKKGKEEADKKKTEPEKKKEPAAAAEGDEKKPEDEKKDTEKSEEKKPEVFTPPKIDPAVMPLVEWIRDKKGRPFVYELRGAAQFLHLQDVLKQAKELPQSPICLTDATRSDMDYVLKQLGEEKAVVLLPTGIGTLPYTVTRLNLPGELLLAGCKIVLMPSRDSESVLKEYRVQLADLVRAGVPRDEVLKAVTLRPAEILGIEKRFGSIEKGKDADFAFFDGDPLHPDTKVQRVMMAGEIVWEAQK